MCCVHGRLLTRWGHDPPFLARLSCVPRLCVLAILLHGDRDRQSAQRHRYARSHAPHDHAQLKITLPSLPQVSRCPTAYGTPPARWAWSPPTAPRVNSFSYSLVFHFHLAPPRLTLSWRVCAGLMLSGSVWIQDGHTTITSTNGSTGSLLSAGWLSHSLASSTCQHGART
jgi:hypothetical protein